MTNDTESGENGNQNRPSRPAWLEQEEKRMKPISEAAAWRAAAEQKQSVPAQQDKTIPSVAGTGHSPFEEGAKRGILPSAKEVDSPEIQQALSQKRKELAEQRREKHVNAAHDAGYQPRPGDTKLRKQLR